MSSGNNTEMRFFTPTPAGEVLRSYINDQGAFNTNAWMVISGQVGNPDILASGVVPPNS